MPPRVVDSRYWNASPASSAWRTHRLIAQGPSRPNDRWLSASVAPSSLPSSPPQRTAVPNRSSASHCVWCAASVVVFHAHLRKIRADVVSQGGECALSEALRSRCCHTGQRMVKPDRAFASHAIWCAASVVLSHDGLRQSQKVCSQGGWIEFVWMHLLVLLLRQKQQKPCQIGHPPLAASAAPRSLTHTTSSWRAMRDCLMQTTSLHQAKIVLVAESLADRFALRCIKRASLQWPKVMKEQTLKLILHELSCAHHVVEGESCCEYADGNTDRLSMALSVDHLPLCRSARNNLQVRIRL